MPPLEKYARLTEILRENAPLAIAFSGGADSALLVAAASGVLPPDRFLALTAVAPIFPAWEFLDAQNLAQALGAPWRGLEVDVLAVPGVAENPPDRCYFCKKAIFRKLMDEAARLGFAVVADGSNADDDLDYRPGTRAALELGVKSPLKAAALTKDEIRALSAHLGLPTWNKPAYACLASRFPYRRPIDREGLARVEAGENVLRGLGFPETRLRHHGDVARLEIAPQDFARFLDEKLMAEINDRLTALGFSFAALDLIPYRRGSLNQGLTPDAPAPKS
jgi:uncharacterized protein